jgi:8-oxo-dGTP pyrophosphatase MutT (NUDIX family)
MLEGKIEHIRRSLASHQFAPPTLETEMRAGVALLLQPQQDDLHILFIHRAHHPQDPWSGHMAFPGGRQEPSDPSLLITTQRETKEEVGIDLEQHGEYLGHLPAVQATARGRAIPMTVAPYVYLVSTQARPDPDPVEVQDTIWVPLAFMQQDGVEQQVRRDLHDGTSIQVPALLYGGKTIWGLTYRMLRGFLELIAQT